MKKYFIIYWDDFEVEYVKSRIELIEKIEQFNDDMDFDVPNEQRLSIFEDGTGKEIIVHRKSTLHIDDE